jgi:dTDP-4-dehydrorhamnose reductase
MRDGRAPLSIANRPRSDDAGLPGKALLLGASGFLGPALTREFGANNIVRTYASHPVDGGVRFDVRSTRIDQLLGGFSRRPEAALILLGQTNVDACARDPHGTAEINVAGIIRVIGELRALGIMPVFTSSDAVFEGTRGNWREDEGAHPVLTYGRQKLEVERHLSSLPPPWLIVRLPKLFAAERNPRCMLTGWVDALGRDDRILCATDQFFTPAEAGDVARAIAQLLSAGTSGLYHLGGPQRLSRRELLAVVLDEYRKHATPSAEIVDCSLRDIPVFEPRPLDVSMDSSRFVSKFGPTMRAASEVARLAVRDHFRTGGPA